MTPVRLGKKRGDTFAQRAKTTGIPQADLLRFAVDQLETMNNYDLLHRYIHWRLEQNEETPTQL